MSMRSSLERQARNYSHASLRRGIIRVSILRTAIIYCIAGPMSKRHTLVPLNTSTDALPDPDSLNADRSVHVSNASCRTQGRGKGGRKVGRM
jgi:hypothetical protein